MEYDKLVRDFVPFKIKDKIATTKVITNKNDIESYVLKKIDEELHEFKENPCLEEAADLVEIVYKYISVKLNSVTGDVLEAYLSQARREKNEEAGSFRENIVLMSVQDVE